MATGLRFKGTIEVLVDPARLEARLILVKEGDLEYDEGAVVRILADAGVTSGFDIDPLVASIQDFQKTKESRTEVLAARGEPPVAPTGEVWEWDEGLLPLPEEKKALAARVIRATGVPEVFNVRVERVKVQKPAAAKGGLFGSSPAEKETILENREVREKVLVDPNPLKVFWVDAGTPVATVLPPRPGQPGKDLAGKALPAPTAKTGSFFTGARLEKHKNQVVASVAGFLRVGRNWADVAPHRAHRWELTYSPDKTSAYLTFEPGDPQADPPAVGPLFDRLKADGFDPTRFPEESAVKDLLMAASREGRSLAAEPLGTDRDGTFAIRFTPDRVKAFLEIRKPLGRGASFSLKDLGTALREAQLKGFSFDAVKGALQEFLTGPQTELTDFLLATGQAPTRGKDLVLEFSTGFLPADEVKAIRQALTSNPKLAESVPDRQSLPPEKVEQAGPVHAGQEFARLVPPEEGAGQDGVDATGQRIPAIPGNEPPLVLLANVHKNGNKLVSAIDGLLEMGRMDGAAVLRVRSHLDAMAAVTRAPDNLSATLTLVQGRGTGRRLDRALVDAAFRAAQVVAGIDEAAVARALETALTGAKVENLPVAQGVPAANDLGRRLSFPQPLRQDSTGKRRCPVRPGEVAATYLPPAADQVDGQDVLGNRIPSPDQEVRSLVVSPDFEVETDAGGRQLLKALKGGDLVFDGESLSIIGQVAVAAVGGKAGNVKFPGEVLVAGGVENGAYVMAGNLKVRGRVGGALLSSDQNIQVADGIHGEGKAVLRAKKHVSVGFVERALIMAVGDVHVGKTALGCTFRVNGRIFQKAPGGGVQGGLIKVRLGMDVMNLGSPNGQPTSVSFGQDYLIEDQILAEAKETDKLREAIVQLDVLMRKLGAPADREKLNLARQKKVLLMKMLDKRNIKLINLRDKFELHVASEIVVRETLFPGVSIESHGRVYEPHSRRTAVRLVFNEQTGHIEEFPLD